MIFLYVKHEQKQQFVGLTEQIQNLPGEQANQLLLQHLLSHSAVLVDHLLLLILVTENTERSI